MSLVWFIVLIGVLITIHELGHLVAARLFHIRVLKLSIGFGPALVTLQRGGTEYAIGLVPLGGYVRLLGEDRGERVRPEERARSFHHRPAWQRLVVILAGPLANLIFPIFIFAQLYARQSTVPSATLGSVLAGQPAADADLRAGDRVIAIDDRPVRTWDDFNRVVTHSPDRALRITVERAGFDQPLTKYVTPRVHLRYDAFGARERVGLIGVAPHFRLPQVGVTDTGCAAYRAGLRSFDVITSIQGRPVENVADLAPLLHPRSGAMLLVTYLRPQPAALGFASVSRLVPGSAMIVPQPLPGQTGWRPHYDTGLRPADLFIHTVEPGTPASRLGGIGLRPGDVLTTLDGVPLTSWELFSQTLEEEPERIHTLGWRSSSESGAAAQTHEATFHLERRRSLDEYQAEGTSWVFGAEGARAIAPVPEVVTEPHLASALALAVGRAMTVTATLVRVLGRTLVGKLPATSIGGPILIYQVAGVAAEHGLEQFLVMAALVSLNLGLLNLLPVPLLDGGQATLLLFEAARRRPVSERVRTRAAYVGVALLVALLLLASRNDLMRHFLP
ncbi:MAG TPA: RIP metalloprotease RseP [Polyangia bacterium]